MSEIENEEEQVNNLDERILLKDVYMLLDDDTDKILYPYELKEFWEEIEHYLEELHDNDAKEGG